MSPSAPWAGAGDLINVPPTGEPASGRTPGSGGGEAGRGTHGPSLPPAAPSVDGMVAAFFDYDMTFNNRQVDYYHVAAGNICYGAQNAALTTCRCWDPGKEG